MRVIGGGGFQFEFSEVVGVGKGGDFVHQGVSVGVFGVQAEDHAHDFARTTVGFNQIKENAVVFKPGPSSGGEFVEAGCRSDGDPCDCGGAIEEALEVDAFMAGDAAVESSFEVFVAWEVSGSDFLVMMVECLEGAVVFVDCRDKIL